MREVLVDTNYWIAIVNPRDNLYRRARQVGSALRDAKLLTTDAILTEYLNHFAGYDPRLRDAAAAQTRDVLEGNGAESVVTGREWLLRGLDLYERRRDKQYSLVDCISMEIMRERDIAEVLTHDHHFAQEGFTILL